MNLVVYSKDRPAQLELLLRSLKRYWNGWETLALTVVYTYSSDGFARGYERVLELHPEPAYVCERDDARSFKELTLAVIDPDVELTAFLVDDDVFRRPFSLEAPEIEALRRDPSLACVALRLAPHVDYTYPLDRLTPPRLDADRTWAWAEGDGYWDYPMSLDGHVFRTAELLPLLRELDFKNPNTLENELALRPLAAPRGICPAEAVVVNIPANRVQSAFPNRCGDVPPEALNVHFRSGALLALEPIAAVVNRGAHEEIPFAWERTSAPTVSVVIPCHNHGRFLAEAVGSVLEQSRPADEILIVDDGSTDDSREVARALAAQHPTVRVLEQPASGHPAHARNAGVRATSGDYVLCLDADDRLSPGFLAACVAGLEQTGGSVAYGPQQDFGTSSAYEAHAVHFDLAMLARCNFVGSASLFRRSAWEDAGGYDASVGYEDWDFWVGCAAAGHLFLHVPDALWFHRNHDGASVFAQHTRDDARIKARIVLKRPQLYTEGQLAWARGVLDGDPGWTSLAAPVGIVPTVNGVPQRHEGPAVSVIVPTHNRPEQLRETLESIAAQTFRDFEVLVVNDAGTDVRDVVESFADRMAVTYLAHEQNRQLAASRNTGIRAARGRYIAYLDDDDVFYPNHLETLVGALAATGARVAYADAVRARVGADGTVARDVPYSFDFSRDRFLFANYIPVNCIVHERSCLDEVGLFDEELATPLEDWELWIRLSQATDFVHVPQVTCEVREADSGRITTNVERFVINRQKIVDKHAALVANRPDLVELQRQYLGVVPSVPAPPAAQPLAGDRIGVLAFSDELLADPALLTVAQGILDEGFALVACGPAELEQALRSHLGRTDALIPLRVTDPAALVPLTAGVAMVLTRRSLPAALAGVQRLDAGLPAPAPAEPAFEIPADVAFGYEDGEYTCEANVLHWLERLVQAAPDAVLYDVGANIGFYSARLAPHARTVVAFEPVSETYGALTRNVAAQTNVHPIQVAVADDEGTAEINLYSSSGNNGLYVRELPAGHPLRHVGSESVETARLDTLVAERGLPLPTVVKIDVEGAELPVLRGAAETLRRARPAVVLEYAETTSRDAGYTTEALAAELEAHGYALYGLAEDPADTTLYAKDAFGETPIANVIAIPPESPFAELVAPAPANVYDELVPPGALVFDIGANVGARTREFLDRGASVVAVEPQRACMAQLERHFGDDPRVLLVENALGAEEGVATMLCTTASTIASMSPDWIDSVRASGRFSEFSWDESIEVPVSTLSALIDQVGEPDFCKIDVEGFESQVLAGLDRPVRSVSFEFVPEHLEGTIACIERLDALGEYEYNLSLGESLGFETQSWRSAAEMRERLTALASTLEWGDVYARLPAAA